MPKYKKAKFELTLIIITKEQKKQNRITSKRVMLANNN